MVLKMTIRKIYILLFCTVSVLLIYFITNHNYALFFGKDNGMLSQILISCLASEILFVFIEKSYLKYFIGLIIGICSYILTYVAYYILFVLIFHLPNGIDIPLIGDACFAFLLIGIFAVYRLKKNYSKAIKQQ